MIDWAIEGRNVVCLVVVMRKETIVRNDFFTIVPDDLVSLGGGSRRPDSN